MTLRDALLEASTHIARREAETLLAHTLRRDRAWLLAHTEDDLSPADLASFRALVARRAAQEPLQYITGTQEFFGLPLRVTPHVLIPRPETEHLVEAVLAWANAQPTPALKIPDAASSRPLRIPDAVSSRPLRIMDIGTGSGAIALALAANLPHAEIIATDLSPAALAVARANAQQLGLTARIHFLEGDLLAALPAKTPPGTPPFDVIVSNPPYVPETDAPTLAPEVRDHEPSLALYAGADGLSLYRRLIPQAFRALRPGGLLALEIGFGQRTALTYLLADPDHAWQNIRFVEDYASISRVALATRP
jgi:release factor glutamine methyltransferase